MKQPQGSTLCIGCGVIPVKVKAIMYRSSSTAGAYCVDNWSWAGLVSLSDVLTALVRDKDVYRYGISFGWKSTQSREAGDPTAGWIRRDRGWKFESGPGGEVRDLTEEEMELLGYGRVK